MKPVCFLGNSLECLREFPDDARQDAGYQLDQVQRGRQPVCRFDARTPMKTKKRANTFASVWDALADTPEQAANLRARADLMRQIAGLIETNGWKQVEAAERCGVTQPRINDLLRGRVSRFSLDALVNIATALGQRVHVELETT